MITTEFQTHFIELLEQSDVAAHSIDRNGHIVCVSNGWLRLLEYERSEVIGRKSVEFLTKQSQEKAKHTLAEFYKTGEVQNIEYTFVKKSGEEITVLLSATSVKTDTGEFINSIAVLNLPENKRFECDCENWVSHQTPDIQTLLKNLTVKVLNDENVVIECPNIYWFKIIEALKYQFKCVNTLELTVLKTGDFQIITILEPSHQISEPIAQPVLFPQVQMENHPINR